MILFPPLLFLALLLARLFGLDCGGYTCPSPVQIPNPLVAAYGSWTECDAKMAAAAEQGAGVLIWFSATLASVNGKPTVSGALPDLDCVARTAGQLRARGLSVVHVLSVGGWNAPLPDASFLPEEWFRAWHAWNRGVAARGAWHGFDGLDWDAEGNETPGRNVFSFPILDLIGGVSVRLKRAGYLVSLAPPQSYLDAAEPGFDLGVARAPPWRPRFPYHGRNLYAYLLAFFAETRMPAGGTVPTFDWVGLQLYEGWSRANFEINIRNVSAAQYLPALVRHMDAGWVVDFGRLGKRTVRVPREKLLLGLANGWTKPAPPIQKFLLLRPVDVAEAWKAMKDQRPRGFMFWTVIEEGKEVDGKPLYYTRSLHDIVSGAGHPKRPEP